MPGDPCLIVERDHDLVGVRVDHEAISEPVAQLPQPAKIHSASKKRENGFLCAKALVNMESGYKS